MTNLAEVPADVARPPLKGQLSVAAQLLEVSGDGLVAELEILIERQAPCLLLKLASSMWWALA